MQALMCVKEIFWFIVINFLRLFGLTRLLHRGKVIISSNRAMRDSWRLGGEIIDSGKIPDLLIAMLRGGADKAFAVQGTLNYVSKRRGGRERANIPYAATITHSYNENKQMKEVKVNSVESVLIFIKTWFISNPSKRLFMLFIDDLSDTGKSYKTLVINIMQAVREWDASKVNLIDFELATLYWKPKKSKVEPEYQPKFYIKTYGPHIWLFFWHEVDEDDMTPNMLRIIRFPFHKILSRLRRN